MHQWIDLEGLANMRDVGGIATADGGQIKSGRLLRSDNLQDLTAADIAELRRRGVTDVIDLRTSLEKEKEGPTPLQAEGDIAHHHFSYFIEVDVDGDGAPDEVESSATGQGPEPFAAGHFTAADVDDEEDDDDATADRGQDVAEKALPWVGKQPTIGHDSPTTAHYLSYLADRPDSVVGALRAIAYAPGASIVHCAAGKDRTGTTVALALLVVDADEAQVVADYAASSERMPAIIDRLLGSETYRENLSGRPMDSHLTLAETMQGVIDHIRSEQGGVMALLASLGWTADDTAALRKKLLDD